MASSPEKLDKYIRTIYNKANDMDRLIDELTFYSKIDTNKIPYTFSKINVNSYFGDCAEEVGLDMESRGIELGYFNYVSDDVVVIADAEQMKRVVNNIISNSVKYMDKPKGIINIRIKDVGDFIQVEIEDNGRGTRRRIFRISLTAFTGLTHREILLRVEVESVFRLCARSLRIMVGESGRRADLESARRCILC